MKNRFGFTDRESRIIEGLNTPKKIQQFIYKLNQHPRMDDSYYSPRVVMRKREADCVDSSLFAAAALRFHGEEPLLMNLAATHGDYSHCLALFRENERWGAITKSDYVWLEYREPIYKNLRELALSYFEGYFDVRRRKTLREYSNPIRLSRFDNIKWMTNEENLLQIARHIVSVPHRPLIDCKMERSLSPVYQKIFNTL